MSRAMRTAMPRPRRRYHPQLVLLEGRLPPGESVLGVLAGAALLPNAGLVVRARGVSEGAADSFAYASGSDQHTTTTWFTAAACQSEAFADDARSILPAVEWQPLAAAFAAPARRPMSPPREQGDTSPLLALRARVPAGRSREGGCERLPFRGGQDTVRIVGKRLAPVSRGSEPSRGRRPVRA